MERINKHFSSIAFSAPIAILNDEILANLFSVIAMKSKVFQKRYLRVCKQYILKNLHITFIRRNVVSFYGIQEYFNKPVNLT